MKTTLKFKLRIQVMIILREKNIVEGRMSTRLFGHKVYLDGNKQPKLKCMVNVRDGEQLYNIPNQ